jgi:hypothetical protein
MSHGSRSLRVALCIVVFAWSPIARASAAATDDLTCKLVVSTNHDFEDCWYHTATNSGPRIQASDKVVKGQEVTAYLFFAHAGRDAGGNAHLTNDVRILRPDGAAYYEASGLESFDGPSPPNGLMLARNLVHLSFDPPDPLGKYEIHLVVHDRVTGKSVPADSTLQLVEFASDAKFTSKDDVAKWMSGHPESPRPEPAVDAFLACARSGMWTEPNTAPAARAFFHERFENDPFLYPVLVSRYAAAGKAERRAIVLLATRSKALDPSVLRSAPIDKADLDAVAADVLPDPLGTPITDPSGLDPVWAVFLASGKYAPVRRVCELVDTTQGPAAAALRKAALESIATQVAAHKLVRDYIAWIVENEKLSAAARENLKTTLSSAH